MKILAVENGQTVAKDSTDSSVKGQIKQDLGLDKVSNIPDSEKEVSAPQQQAINSKFDSVVNAIPLGAYNASTNSPALSAVPFVALADGSYYDVTASGILNFAGDNFSAGITANAGDQLKKKGNKWYIIPSIIPDSVKSILSTDYSIANDKSITNAIRRCRIELPSTYQSGNVAIRLLGFESVNKLMIQLWDKTINGTGAVIYNIPLDASVSAKPSGIRTYSYHIPYVLFVEIEVDWSSFVSSLLQSSTYTSLPVIYPYNQNRVSILQLNNGLKSFDVNGIDEKICLAIHEIKFEHINNKNDWRVQTLGWDGSAVFLRLKDLTSNTTLHLQLEEGTVKPSGTSIYRMASPYLYFIEVKINWDSWTGNNLISTAFSAKVIVGKYDKSRINSGIISNGIKSFSINGKDDQIAYAIKEIYFEYLDGTTNFAIIQIGYDGSKLVLILRNLTLGTNFFIQLDGSSAKPSGENIYILHKSNEYYLKLKINWSDFPSNSLLSTTYTSVIQVLKYDSARANQVSELDYNVENFRLNSPKKYQNAILDWNRYALETGSILSGQDSANSNRIRTKYSIRLKTGTTLNYLIASGYKIIVQQVKTTGIKTFTLLKDSGALSGTGSLVLDTNTESIRLAFLKYASDNTTEVQINPSDITQGNFAITTDVASVESVNQATAFTDDQLMNSFIKEMYIEGLDKTKSYYIYHVRRNVSGSWRIYIYDKATNTSVFNFGTAVGDFNENGIFDRTLNNIRVRAVLDWSVLPIGYHNLGMSVNLMSDKIFNVKYCPTIKDFYNEFTTRGSKILLEEEIAAIDNNDVNNANIPFQRDLVAKMNTINAELVRNATKVKYDDSLTEPKNGSVGIAIGNVFYECCQNRDTEIYDSTSIAEMREINMDTKAMGAKTRLIGYPDTISGVPMTRIPYVFSCIQLSTNIIRVFVRIRTASGEKMGYVDFDIATKLVTPWAELTLNGSTFDIGTYYRYIRDNIDFTLTSGFGSNNVGMTLGRHVMKYGSDWYMLTTSNVGLLPYSGTYYSIAKSSDAINWTIIYTFKNRNGQDDGDMYIRNGILYAQLRQSWGSKFSVISAYNLATNKEITSDRITSATCRGEFFEHFGNLYLLINPDDNRQYALVYKVEYENEALNLIPLASPSWWTANWSVVSYNSKVLVFFGVEVWEFDFLTYNDSVNTKLFDLLK